MRTNYLVLYIVYSVIGIVMSLHQLDSESVNQLDVNYGFLLLDNIANISFIHLLTLLVAFVFYACLFNDLDGACFR